ncbi:MAG: hypothetical protein ACI9FN_000221 [Saprospiraceae bacterium]|jgi:hypothetical protein
MSILDVARLVVYRFHQKGLEIFLVNSDIENDPDVWRLPDCDRAKFEKQLEEGDFIEIDLEEEGRSGQIYAVEGDWHTMPSIRGLIKHDVKVAKSLVKEALPGIEKGAFFAFKEGVKQTMPSEYKALKELKEILIDRNTVSNI